MSPCYGLNQILYSSLWYSSVIQVTKSDVVGRVIDVTRRSTLVDTFIPKKFNWVQIRRFWWIIHWNTTLMLVWF